MTLSAFLRQSKLSQAEFAARAGVPASQVSLWLHGRRKPGLESAAKIEAATGGAVTAADWLAARRRSRRSDH